MIRDKWLWLALALNLEKYNTSGPTKASSTPGLIVTLFIAAEAVSGGAGLALGIAAGILAVADLRKPPVEDVSHF